MTGVIVARNQNGIAIHHVLCCIMPKQVINNLLMMLHFHLMAA